MDPIPYGKHTIEQADIDAVVDALKSGWITQGPTVLEFEKQFAEYVGAKYAVSTTSGTTALHLCAKVLEAGPNDTYLCSPLTFVASSNAILYESGNVELVDICPKTYTMDIDRAEKIIESSPGKYTGLVITDYAGRPADRERVSKLCEKYQLKVIYDACHSLGARYTDSSSNTHIVGSCAYGGINAFSFHPVKHITTCEGGMITTNDKKIYKRLQLLKTHGIVKNHNNTSTPWVQEMVELGYNYRLPDILAALGISQLKRAEESLDKRLEIAAYYDRELSELEIELPHRDASFKHGFHLYAIQSDQRDQLYTHLRANNVGVQVHYVPVHQMPYYIEYFGKKLEFPNTDSFYQRCLSLPIYPTLKREEQDYVIQKIKEFFN
ncbi:MAG: UDP-4-amino-4,6-dideoxy-N-acetyl-beta-L-altrosamine transaminase [Bacteriovoracaceae bacterium]|nr:UDP-4-amino-4,6-dideoxy-N-acetyl-beta-L-altrosamine transaminase [Bacteriovoracaceae bacterium]